MVFQINIFGQPGSCDVQALNIIENIRGVNLDTAEIYSGRIMRLGETSVYDIVTKNSIDTKKLTLTKILNQLCIGISDYKSNLKNRFYYSDSHSIFVDNVLIIKNGGKKMYIVFPDSLNYNHPIMRAYFLDAIINTTNFLNVDKGNYRPSIIYYPTVYISGIDFQEGVFFVKDYEKKFGIKTFQREDISEFFTDGDYKIPIYNPVNVWNEVLYFVSPFDENRGLDYSKSFQGNYTESQAIEIIAKNSPEIIESLLINTIYIPTESPNRKLFEEIWYSMLGRNKLEIQNRELMKKYDAKEMSISRMYEIHKTFLETDFFTILKSDFELALKYHNYLIDEKNDLKLFKDFIQKNNLQFTKEQLERFIDSVEK